MDWDVMLGECHEGCCSEQSGSSLSPSGSQPAPRPPSPATLPARQTPPPAPPPPLSPPDHLAKGDGVCDIAVAGINVRTDDIQRGITFSWPTYR